LEGLNEVVIKGEVCLKTYFENQIQCVVGSGEHDLSQSVDQEKFCYPDFDSKIFPDEVEIIRKHNGFDVTFEVVDSSVWQSGENDLNLAIELSTGDEAETIEFVTPGMQVASKSYYCASKYQVILNPSHNVICTLNTPDLQTGRVDESGEGVIYDNTHFEIFCYYPPSLSPTQNPTVAPSVAPTDAPSQAPTDMPTVSPSVGPTSTPSVAPIVAPTVSPTQVPTDKPTLSPSVGPSSAPSVAPTLAPTSPTPAPSINTGCASGYVLIPNGDVGGWGSINGRGGGEILHSCSHCADLCNAENACKSYECDGDGQIRCSLNHERMSTTTNCGPICQRQRFCSKISTTPTKSPSIDYSTTDIPNYSTTDIPSTTALSEFGAREKGWCVRSNGEDSDSQVTKADRGFINNSEGEWDCLQWCMTQDGLTGCEFNWGPQGEGCYAHRGEVSRGNGAEGHFCWVSIAEYIPDCVAIPNWNAGYGECQTYASSILQGVGGNHVYCKTDTGHGHFAFEVCAECGECNVSDNPPQTTSHWSDTTTEMPQ